METTTVDDKTSVAFVESLHEEAGKATGQEPRIIGTLKLVDGEEIILVPAPTRDPRDPLNLPDWRKWLMLIIVALYGMTGNLLASGIGVLVPQLQEYYHGDSRVNDLVTYPALFMGIGNLIAVPFADAIGRRPVYLFSNIVLIAGGIWCSYSDSLGSHIGGRDFMALAAGQSEALCVMIAEETFFLHQRGSRIAWFCSLQTLGTALFIIASSYLTESLGWRWWYGIFTIISAATFVLSILFVAETKYDRPLNSFFGFDPQGNTIKESEFRSRRLDYDTYPDRTFWHDLRPWGHVSAKWREVPKFWLSLGQLSLFPGVLYFIILSGVLLGTYIVMTAVFAQVLISPPYSFDPHNLGFVMGGQAVVAFVVQPLAGYLSDFVLKFWAKRNDGFTEPESRLIPAVIPLVVGIISCVIYGQACQFPEDWAWPGVVVPLNALFYSFVSIVVLSFVYTMDCYPQRGHVAMVALCAGRGFISFGISFGTTAFFHELGYNGALNVCAIVIGVLFGLGIVLYFTGKYIRRFTQKWATDED
ncbi:major facilitator superfamily domain-containing protein [Aspergillus heterothallicus]